MFCLIQESWVSDNENEPQIRRARFLAQAPDHVLELMQQSERLDAPGMGRTMKFKFTDRLSALALIGKACHWYADRQEQTGPDGGPIAKNVTVTFVEPSMSPEEAYIGW